MDIFLSWSGERSRKAAEAFYHWLPDVLQSVRPWMSSEDIRSGAGWNQQIRTALNTSNFGIVFVTRDNQESTWLMFEAGALAKHVEEACVVPLIVDDDLTPAMLDGPLGQLQAREANKEKVRRLVHDINFNAEVRISDDRVDRCFAANWKRLKEMLDKLPPPEGEKPELDEKAMLSQILGILRSEGRKGQTIVLGRAVEDQVDKIVARERAKKSLLARLSMANENETFQDQVISVWETIPPGVKFLKFVDDKGRSVKVLKYGNFVIDDVALL